MPSGHEEGKAGVILTLQRNAAIYRHLIHIETLDSADERVLIDVPAGIGIRGISLEVHHAGKTAIGLDALGFAQGVDDQASIGVMKRGSAGGVDPAEANDDGKPAGGRTHWRTPLNPAPAR